MASPLDRSLGAGRVIDCFSSPKIPVKFCRILVCCHYVVPSNHTKLCRKPGSHERGENRTPDRQVFCLTLAVLRWCCLLGSALRSHLLYVNPSAEYLHNSRSPCLQDFKGLILLHERYDLHAKDGWMKWLLCRLILHGCLPAYHVSLSFTLSRINIQETFCALCSEGRWCFLMDLVFLHSRVSSKKLTHIMDSM